MYLSSKAEVIIKKIIGLYPESTLSIGTFYQEKLSWRVYGKNCRLNKEKLQNYEIGSLTKVFTAFYFIELFKEKVVTSQTKINEVVSDLPTKNYPTIGELLTHQSGYGYLIPLKLSDLIGIIKHKGICRYNPYESNMCADNVRKILIEKKIPTHRRRVYSNFGYAVLGLILSELEAKNYEECINAFSKKKLGLNHTNFGNTDLLPGYFRNKNYGNWQWLDCENNLGKATGGLRSNVVDMLKFSSKILAESTFLKRAEPFSLMGMFKRQDGIWMKIGQTGTQLSVMMIDTESSSSAVVLVNCLNKYSVSLTRELLLRVFEE